MWPGERVIGSDRDEKLSGSPRLSEPASPTRCARGWPKDDRLSGGAIAREMKDRHLSWVGGTKPGIIDRDGRRRAATRQEAESLGR